MDQEIEGRIRNCWRYANNYMYLVMQIVTYLYYNYHNSRNDCNYRAPVGRLPHQASV